MFSISLYSLESNFFKFLRKKIIMFALNKKYQKYHVWFIPPLLKKSNIPFPYYAILLLLSNV